MAGSWSDQFIVKIAANTDVQLCDPLAVATVAVILNAPVSPTLVLRPAVALWRANALSLNASAHGGIFYFC